MNLRDFGQKIKEHKLLDLASVKDEDGTLWIGIKHLEKEDGREVPLEHIEANSWEHLEPVLLGIKEGSIMRHITRIVGYYSRTACWNASKLEELADRHKGKYSLPEVA